MDPNTCFERWLDAVQHGEEDDAADFALDYYGWRARGGFCATDEHGADVLLLGRHGCYMTATGWHDVPRGAQV